MLKKAVLRPELWFDNPGDYRGPRLIRNFSGGFFWFHSFCCRNCHEERITKIRWFFLQYIETHYSLWGIFRLLACEINEDVRFEILGCLGNPLCQRNSSLEFTARLFWRSLVRKATFWKPWHLLKIKSSCKTLYKWPSYAMRALSPQLEDF